jgi:hypothetical protein
VHDLARCRAETSVSVGCDDVANGMCARICETAPGTTRERQVSARAQTAHNVEPRGEFYGDRAGRDMCFARARDADSPTFRPITDIVTRNNV